MPSGEITERDRRWAQQCISCGLCAHARKRQRGVAFWVVKKIEGSICPFCKAYERVYGRKSHEATPGGAR